MPSLNQIRDTVIEHMTDQLHEAGWMTGAPDFRENGVGFVPAEKDGRRILFQTNAHCEAEMKTQPDVSKFRDPIMRENQCRDFRVADVPVSPEGNVTSEGTGNICRIVI
jgi:hypothetical protein